MTHPLDGARLKVVRAQEHLDVIKDEIGRYLKTNPYELLTKQEGYWEVLPEITVEPPLRIASLVGDCLCNIMPALDYIVWELASKFAPFTLNPPPIGQDKPSFPLYNDPDRFRINLHRFSRYKIPADAVREIEAVQPFNRGYEPLWLLYLLVSSDKHRLPTLTIAHIRGLQKLRRDADGTLTQIASLSAQRGIVTIDDGTPDEQFLARLNKDLSQAPVQMHFRASLFVAFQDVSMPREPVDLTLEQIIKTVADVIPRFDRFF